MVLEAPGTARTMLNRTPGLSFAAWKGDVRDPAGQHPSVCCWDQIGSPNAPYLRDEGFLDDTALMINCEHIAPTQFIAFNNELRLTTTVSPRRWWVYGSNQLLDITLDAYRTFGVSVIGEMDGRATGEMMAIDKEAPSVQLIRSPEHKHTDGDIPTLVPAAGLEAVARAYAKIIDQVNRLDLSDLQPSTRSSRRQLRSRAIGSCRRSRCLA